MTQPHTAPGTSGAVTQITVADLQRQLAAGTSAQLIDVRSDEEFRQDGHIAGATLIPLPSLSMRMGEIRRDAPVVVICRSGNRSQVASDMLVNAGYRDVSNMQGGMIAWRGAGFPAE